jgi:hypothetical protein
MSRRSVKTSVLSVVWVLVLTGGILAHRAGMLPGWVYQGRLRDEVKRRTGVDLADRSVSVARPVLEVGNFRGSGGRYPTLTFDVRNATDSTIRHVEMWADFHLATADAGSSPRVTVARRDSAPLRPGETRTVTVRVRNAQGLGITTRGPLLTADLYWAFSPVRQYRRTRPTPNVAMIPVR